LARGEAGELGRGRSERGLDLGELGGAARRHDQGRTHRDLDVNAVRVRARENAGRDPALARFVADATVRPGGPVRVDADADGALERDDARALGGAYASVIATPSA